MRLIKIFILIPIFLYLLLPFDVYSKTSDEIITTPLKKSEITNDYSVTLLHSEPEKSSIVCFDVDDSNNIALVTENSSSYYVSVYDNSFNFKYSFVFAAAADVNIEWNEDNITIYYHRDNLAVSYNNLGEIIDVNHFDDTTENSIRFINMEKPFRQVGETKYKLQNDLGVFNFLVGQSSYSQLIKINEQGNEVLLYNVNSLMFTKTIIFYDFNY